MMCNPLLYRYKKKTEYQKKKMKYGQCVTAANKKGTTLLDLNDSRCCTGQKTASSYDIFVPAAGRCGSTKGGLCYGFLRKSFLYQKKEGKLMRPHAFVFKRDFHGII